MKEVFDCWARDPVKIIADLLGNPEFQGEQKYAPYLQHLEELSGQLDGADEEERDRIFDEMASAEWWRRLQVINISLQPSSSRTYRDVHRKRSRSSTPMPPSHLSSSHLTRPSCQR